MLNADCSQHKTKTVSCVWPASLAEVISPSAISYQSNEPGPLARQVLIFENAPSISKNSPGKGIALVELADGRVFFFNTSMAVLEVGDSQDSLFKELTKLPVWITSWKGAAEVVGFAVGAALEFVEEDPGNLESWNIQGWKQYTASKLVINRTTSSIRQISTITIDAAKELETALSERINEFMRALDQSALGQHSHLRCSWQTAYNFFNPADEKKKLYRRQANQTFPLFMQQLFRAPKEELTASSISAIDAGLPLVDFLATTLSCPRKCIRHLNGLGLDDIGIQWNGRIKELVMILAGLDMNRLPKSRQEWVVFSDTINLLLKMTKMPTTAVSSRMLLGELAKLHWNRKLNVSASFEERALAIERFAENIRRSIIATAWVNGGDANQAGGVVQRLATEAACSLGLLRLEKLSRMWRAEELRLDSASSTQSRYGFPVILEEPMELGELKILQLTDPAQLAVEGRRMSNCVGTYIGQCSSGHAYIFSIRDKSGVPCVTIEYQLVRSSSGLPELHLVQQKGRDNEAPDSKYQSALHLLDRFAKSPQNRKKLLDLLILQKAVEKGGSDLAARYSRSLEFIEFLEQEVPGRFDFSRLSEAAVC